MTTKVKQGSLFINNEKQVKRVTTPTTSDILQLTAEETEGLVNTPATTAVATVEKGNIFVPYAAKISSIEDIRKLYPKVKLLHPDSDHVMMAYQFGSQHGRCDDGEHLAGSKILRTLLASNETNLVVFVTGPLGPGVQWKTRRRIEIITLTALLFE